MDGLLLIFVVLVLPLIVAALIVLAARRICATRPRMYPPVALVGAHACAVAVTMIPWVFGAGFGGSTFDDIYLPFFIYPGLYPYWLEGQLVPLFQRLWPNASGYVILVLPHALTTLIVGSGIWYLLGRLSCVSHYVNANDDASPPT